MSEHEKELYRLRNSSLDVAFSAEIVRFMACGSTQRCSKSMPERKQAINEYIKTNTGFDLDDYPVSNLPTLITCDDLSICLELAGITLADLYTELGHDFHPSTDDEAFLVLEFSKLSNDDIRIKPFLNEISHLVADYWFAEEFFELGPTDRFLSLRRRKLSHNERVNLDNTLGALVPSYFSVIGDRHIPSTSSIDAKYFGICMNALDIPPHWLFGLGDKACAFVQNPYADKAIDAYIKMGAQGRKVFSTIYNAIFSDLQRMEFDL